MDLFLWQIVFVITIFAAVIVCCLIPILLLRKRYATDSANHACKKLLSWLNCVTGGVFLAMCFLSLLPNVNTQMMMVLKDYHIDSEFPLAECIILISFFVVLAIDQASRHCEKSQPDRRLIEMDSIGLDDYRFANEPSGDDVRRTLLTDEDEEEILMERGPSGETVNSNRGSGGTVRQYRDVPVEEDDDGADRTLARRAQIRMHNTSRHHHSHASAIDLMENPPHALQFIVLLFALSTHALFEGIVLGLQKDIGKALHLFTAIILHEAVVAITLGFNIAKAKHSVWTAVRYSLLFSVTIPVGIGLGMAIGQTPGSLGHLISGGLQGLAAGIFLHITFMQLLPEEFTEGSKDGLVKTLFLLIGFLLLMFLNLTVGVYH